MKTATLTFSDGRRVDVFPDRVPFVYDSIGNGDVKTIVNCGGSDTSELWVLETRDEVLRLLAEASGSELLGGCSKAFAEFAERTGDDLRELRENLDNAGRLQSELTRNCLNVTVERNEFKAELFRVNGQLEAMIESRDRLLGDVVELTKERDDLKAELEELRVNHASVVSAHDALLTQAAAWVTERATLNDAVKTRDIKIFGLNTQLINRNSELIDLKIELAAVAASPKVSEESYKKACEERDLAVSQRDEFAAALASVNRDNERLHLANGALTADNSALRRTVGEVTTRVKSLADGLGLETAPPDVDASEFTKDDD